MEYLENPILSLIIKVLLSNAREIGGERPRGICCTVLLTTSLKTVAINHWLLGTYPNVCLLCLISWTESTTSSNSNADPHEIENHTDLGGKDPVTENVC